MNHAGEDKTLSTDGAKGVHLETLRSWDQVELYGDESLERLPHLHKTGGEEREHRRSKSVAPYGIISQVKGQRQ